MEAAKTKEGLGAEKPKEAFPQKQNLISSETDVPSKRFKLNKDWKARKLVYHMQFCKREKETHQIGCVQCPHLRTCIIGSQKRYIHPTLRDRWGCLFQFCSPYVLERKKTILAAQIDKMWTDDQELGSPRWIMQKKGHQSPVWFLEHPEWLTFTWSENVLSSLGHKQVGKNHFLTLLSCLLLSSVSSAVYLSAQHKKTSKKLNLCAISTFKVLSLYCLNPLSYKREKLEFFSFYLAYLFNFII